MEHTMSSESSVAPRRRRRYGWWIVGGIFVALIGFPLGTGLYFAAPIKLIYGLMTGNPSLPGCNTTIVREAAAGPLQYRIVNMSCQPDQTYWVYVKRSGDVLFLPAFVSIGSPIPVSVRQTDDKHFEVVLTEPLADGRTSVPFVFDQDGFIKDVLFFEQGNQSSEPGNPSGSKSLSSDRRRSQSIPD
jgi:hypothetical protein